jgi:hypothetical protein
MKASDMGNIVSFDAVKIPNMHASIQTKILGEPCLLIRKKYRSTITRENSISIFPRSRPNDPGSPNKNVMNTTIRMFRITFLNLVTINVI